MHVQVVTFNLKDMTAAGFERACEEQFAPVFAAFPGLIYKLWLANPETNTYGGVCAWRSWADMEAFIRSELFAAVAGHPNFANVRSQEFGILEGPTRATNGLVGLNA